jgi:hypothetical protein
MNRISTQRTSLHVLSIHHTLSSHARISHGHRPASYSPFDYFGEFGNVINAINADNNIPVKNQLIGPSIATGAWTPEMVWDTNFIPTYTNSLGALAVEQYVVPPFFTFN